MYRNFTEKDWLGLVVCFLVSLRFQFKMTTSLLIIFKRGFLEGIRTTCLSAEKFSNNLFSWYNNVEII